MAGCYFRQRGSQVVLSPSGRHCVPAVSLRYCTTITNKHKSVKKHKCESARKLLLVRRRAGKPVEITTYLTKSSWGSLKNTDSINLFFFWLHANPQKSQSNCHHHQTFRYPLQEGRGSTISVAVPFREQVRKHLMRDMPRAKKRKRASSNH
jgi:hypothetical protein